MDAKYVRYIKETPGNSYTLTLGRKYLICDSPLIIGSMYYLRVLNDRGHPWYALEEGFEYLDVEQGLKISW